MPKAYKNLYQSISAMLCVICAIILLPVPLIAAIRVAWPWVFVYAAYPFLALGWGLLHHYFCSLREGNDDADNQA